MIAGQSAVLLHQNDSEIDEDVLDFIYENKTSKLIMAAVVVPSILCGGKYYSELKLFGRDLGFLFQITDLMKFTVVIFLKMEKPVKK